MDKEPTQLLFEGDHLKLVHLPGASDFSIVTFDVKAEHRNGRTGYALSLARKLGLNYYGVIPNRPNWYPAQEARAIAAIVARAKDRPLLGYGTSMGGYGCLKYGRALQTDATLAFAPQATIDPKITGKDDNRFSAFFDPTLNADMQIRPGDIGPQTYVIHDPDCEKDAFQMSLLGPLGHQIELPLMAHQPVAAMTPSQNALANMTEALRGHSVALARNLRRSARLTRQYALGATQAALDAGDGAAALQIVQDTITTHGTHHEAIMLRARAYEMLGRPKAGIADIQALAAQKPHHITYRRLLADLHLSAGQPDAAIAELKDAVAQSGNGFLAVRLSKMLRAHRPQDVPTFVAQAVQRWPDRVAQFA